MNTNIWKELTTVNILAKNVQFMLLNVTDEFIHYRRAYQKRTLRYPDFSSFNQLHVAGGCVVCSRRLRLSHSVTRSGYQSVLKMHCSLEDVSIIFNLLKPLKTPIEWGEGSCEVVHCSLEIRVNLNLKISGAIALCLPILKSSVICLPIWFREFWSWGWQMCK